MALPFFSFILSLIVLYLHYVDQNHPVLLSFLGFVLALTVFYLLYQDCKTTNKHSK